MINTLYNYLNWITNYGNYSIKGSNINLSALKEYEDAKNSKLWDYVEFSDKEILKF